MKNLLEIDGVLLEFGLKKVLQDIYFKAETGQITGLLGRNGSGKSSLLNILFGELNPVNKSIRLNGSFIDTTKKLNKDIKYLPQANFIPNALTLNRVFSDFNLDLSEFISHFPQFQKYYNSPMHLLSGGERRVVELYIILVSESKFCLLDEPFSEIMPLHVETFKQLMIKEKEKKGIVITDHMYRHVLDISDNMYVLKNGKTYVAKDKNDLEKLGYL